jgi:hypothetical protein
MDLDRSRRQWRRAFIALLIVRLCTLEAAAYGLIDQAVTLDYQGVGYRDLARDAGILARLAPAAAPTATRETVLSALRRQNPKAFITADDSTVGIGQLRFVFGADGRLRAVRHPELEARASPGA